MAMTLKESAGTSIDPVDQLRQQWRRFDPSLDTRAMDSVGRMVHLVSHWDAEINIMLKPYGINYTDFDILATLCRVGSPYKLTPTDLLRSVLLTSGAMTTALSRLERSGLITRIEDPDDRRVKHARLTRKGQALARKTAAKRFELAGEHASGLTRKELIELEVLLRKMQRSMPS